MNEKQKSQRPLKRHFILMKILRFLFGWFFTLRFNLKYKKIKLRETPSVILMNHNSDYDPIFAGVVVRDHMYFVISEHIMRSGIGGRLIRFIFDPIVRVKGTTEVHAAREILQTLRAGLNVCVFAEGNRSFNGETGYISPSTGKLVKRSGAALVTYTFHGGYFSTPRWAKGIRRGVMRGEAVAFYSKEQLKAMTDEEINEAINRDLYINAYDDQRSNDVMYRARKNNYAVGIEIALYICPVCGRIGSIKSNENRFFCDCGLDMVLKEDGWLVSSNGDIPKFDSILDWDRWQVKQLTDKLQESDDITEAIFSDPMQILSQFISGGESTELITGTATLYRDRLEFKDHDKSIVIYLNNIEDIENTGRMTITFVTKDKVYYEIKSQLLRSPTKYRDSFRILRGMNL